MNNEEKILQAITQIQTTLTQMQTDLAGVKADQADMKTELAEVKLLAQGNRILIEQDVDHKLGLLADGHGLLVERLDALEDVKALAEETKAKVDVIYDVVSQHSIDIKAIKNSTILPFPKDKAK